MKLYRSFGAAASWFGILWALIVLAIGSAQANELLPPQQVIQGTSERMQQSLQLPEFRGNFGKATSLVDTILESHVDFDRVSALILGKHWKSASPAQKTQFKSEFRKLIVRTYATAFTEYANWNIKYLPISLQPADNKVVVKTEIQPSGAQAVKVDYRMISEAGDWKVYDVIIEGISLVQNYRTSFTEEIARTGSIDELIKRLSERNSAAMKEPLKADSKPPVAGS